jgi:hypothetical protein
MCHRVRVIVISLSALSIGAEPLDLGFKPSGNGLFDFDTGVVRGRLRSDEQSQGIPIFVDVETGANLAYGFDNPGIFSYYRILSANKRWGDAARTWPKSSKPLPDKCVQIHWPADVEHPIEITATYRWTSANTLDLETVVKPDRDMKCFEVFLSSYFNKNFKSAVYVGPALHASGKPAFLAPEFSPLVAGTYLAFPRDRRSAQIIYDGRWEYGPHPVQFSVTQFLALPLCMKQDPTSGITLLIMSRPEDCFAIETPYNMDPPDGVAGHYSMYISLFGEDIQAGQTARAHTRLIVERNVSARRALDLYHEFIDEKN